MERLKLKQIARVVCRLLHQQTHQFLILFGGQAWGREGGREGGVRRWLCSSYFLSLLRTCVLRHISHAIQDVR